MRTSYLPREIVWGHQFHHSCVQYSDQTHSYHLDFQSFNSTIRDNTPR